MHGARIINSMFTLALICGVTVSELTQGTTMGNLGFEGVKFPNPLFAGDTVTTKTEILDRRESKKYPQAGIVTFKHVGYNQKGDVVCEATRLGLMLKTPA
ncbi:MAG: MaoC family dehydratase [Proteobacteria bacterium]|nr:MaoC family dehydratase [Pseudomonadota bacterium]